MYAVIAIGSHQYRVEPDAEFTVFRRDADEGEELVLDDVRLYRDEDEVHVGEPTVEGARVRTRVAEHYRGDKITVFDYKRRHGHRRKLGHRDDLTRLVVEAIEPPGS